MATIQTSTGPTLRRSDETSPEFSSDSQSRTEDLRLRQLADRLMRGDSSALSDIWKFYGNELRRRARTRLRQYGISGQAESMDICNAVLLELVQQQDIHIRNPADLVRYVSRAIDHQVLDLIKGFTRDRRDIRRVAASPVEDHNVANSADSPSAFLIRNELLESIRAELGSDGDKMLKLYLANYGWKEIGAELQMAPDAARMKWTRAVQSLRDRFEDSAG